MPSSSGGYEAITTYDQQGFETIITVPAGWETMSKSFDSKGFLITPTPALRPTGHNVQAAVVSSQTDAPVASTSSAAAPSLGGTYTGLTLAGLVALLAMRA